MIREPLSVFVVLAGIVYVAIWIEGRWRVARMLSSVLLAILLAAVVANLGVLPSRSPAYDVLGGLGVDLGIALILLGVDVRSVRRAGPRMLGAFGLGAAGTALGAMVGTLGLHEAIGPEAWKLAGQYTGTYTGGSVNMVAVGRALDTSAELFAAAVAADNVTTTIWMVICFGAPAMLARWWREVDPSSGKGEAERVASEEAHFPLAAARFPTPADHGAAPPANAFTSSVRAITLHDAAALTLLALSAVWVAGLLEREVPWIPRVLWLTTLVLIAAQLAPVRRLAGGPLLGNYALQLFLAGVGAQSILAEIARVGIGVFYFTLVVVGVHGLLVFGAGRLLGFDLPTLVVASQANVGGPASAMALASARGYADRVLPGVAVGLIGYAVGNYLGLGVAAVMRGVVGG